MHSPRQAGHLLIAQPFVLVPFALFDSGWAGFRRPNEHSIEILVQAVEQEQEQLLRVLLLVRHELLVELTERAFEATRRYDATMAVPHGAHDHRELVGYLAPKAELVRAVEIVAVRATHEVLDELFGARQTLYDRVHEARVAQIANARETRVCIAFVFVLKKI